MSISTISQSQASTALTTPTIEDVKNNLQNPHNWLYLIPTIGAVVIGTLFAPNFLLGMAAGVAIGFTAIIITKALATLGIFKTEGKNSEYMKQLFAFPLLGTLIAPVAEELVFRGGIQPLLTRTLIWLVPTTTAIFAGTGLSIAAAVSIVATAAIFGFAHIFNQHQNSHIQAIITAVEGVAFGILAAQFGLGASIAAHLTINTILITLGKIVYKAAETSNPSGQLIRA